VDIKLIASGSRPWELWRGYWGLSYLVDNTILYDTFGNYRVLARRLQKADIDASTVQAVVLSHDHWDHTGGLWGFLKEHSGIDVFLPPTAKEAVKRRVSEAGGYLIDLPGIKTLKEDVLLLDEMIGTFNNKPIAEHFIALKAQEGLVLLVGCSHPGIVSMVKKAKEDLGAPVYGVVGGLHLMHSETEEIYACANALKNEGVKMIAPTHCTGWRAERVFKKVFGKGFIPTREGRHLSF
jgi:7,8-dihydropterin-6-yl-methyl-4-(beta-D-ribofuranosyl)aminobenzene 5'-phosphate synthase